jgi:hypothetical protein
MPCEIYRRFTQEIEKLEEASHSKRPPEKFLATRKRTNLIVERNQHAQECAERRAGK